MRILVVDDNPDVAKTVAELLRLDGHDDVQVAFDGATALALIRQSVPDLVLCDLSLPGGVDGLDVARACGAEPPLRSVRLVAMSGYSSDEDRARAIEAGFDELLGKPIRYETLSHCVRAGTKRR